MFFKAHIFIHIKMAIVHASFKLTFRIRHLLLFDKVNLMSSTNYITTTTA